MSPNQKKVLKFVVWTVPVAFLENILFGWAQMELGITNQHVENAVRWAIQLGIPALTVAVGFYLYYKVVERFGPNEGAEWRAEEPLQPAAVKDPNAPLRSLSNSELRQRAMNLAAEMRAFEANFKAAERVRQQEGFARHSIDRNRQTEEQKNAAWHTDLLKDEQQRGHFHTEFMTRYYSIAVPIRHELCARLGLFPPYSQNAVALDHGMLAGVNPVTEAADLLDRLAGKLS